MITFRATFCLFDAKFRNFRYNFLLLKNWNQFHYCFVVLLYRLPQRIALTITHIDNPAIIIQKMILASSPVFTNVFG